jgi:hypothetical protein
MPLRVKASLRRRPTGPPIEARVHRIDNPLDETRGHGAPIRHRAVFELLDHLRWRVEIAACGDLVDPLTGARASCCCGELSVLQPRTYRRWDLVHLEGGWYRPRSDEREVVRRVVVPAWILLLQVLSAVHASTCGPLGLPKCDQWGTATRRVLLTATALTDLARLGPFVSHDYVPQLPVIHGGRLAPSIAISGRSTSALWAATGPQRLHSRVGDHPTVCVF